MDTETTREAIAQGVLQTLIDNEYGGVPARLAAAWKINSSHISQLMKDDHLSPKLDGVLVNRGLLERKPPKDPRARVWMRTDNPDQAVVVLLGHYKAWTLFNTIQDMIGDEGMRLIGRMAEAKEAKDPVAALQLARRFDLHLRELGVVPPGAES